jgi:hypothetical protein
MDSYSEGVTQRSPGLPDAGGLPWVDRITSTTNPVRVALDAMPTVHRIQHHDTVKSPRIATLDLRLPIVPQRLQNPFRVRAEYFDDRPPRVRLRRTLGCAAKRLRRKCQWLPNQLLGIYGIFGAAPVTSIPHSEIRAPQSFHPTPPAPLTKGGRRRFDSLTSSTPSTLSTCLTPCS